MKSLSFFPTRTHEHTHTRTEEKRKKWNDDVCSLFLFLPLYFARPFLVVACNTRVWCKCELWGSPFFFSKSRSFVKKMVETLNMKKLEFDEPKDLVWREERQKKKTHTHTNSTMGVSTSYLSLSLFLFSLARWVQKISQKMNVDAFTRLYLRAMSVCARVCTAKFVPPEDLLFRARKNLRVKKISLARSRVHTHRREDSWDLNWL